MLHCLCCSQVLLSKSNWNLKNYNSCVCKNKGNMHTMRNDVVMHLFILVITYLFLFLLVESINSILDFRVHGHRVHVCWCVCVVFASVRLVLICVCCHTASIVSAASPSRPPHLPSRPRLISLSVGRQVTAPAWLGASVEALVKSLCQAWITPRC